MEYIYVREDRCSSKGPDDIFHPPLLIGLKFRLLSDTSSNYGFMNLSSMYIMHMHVDVLQTCRGFQTEIIYPPISIFLFKCSGLACRA